jgi:toxin-antitoxin system PIN domain toxin
MRSLLDVNVLVALFDPDHTFHTPAIGWFQAHAGEGWASCPITQNGCLRVLSSPGYSNSLPVQEVAARLAELCADPVHQFWPDDFSMLDESAVDIARVHGPKANSDIYLLALACRHGGRLVTFDSGIARNAVGGAGSQHLLSL